MNNEFKDRAHQLVNDIYQPLGYLKCHVSNDEMWEWAKVMAKKQVAFIRSEIPRYKTRLNAERYYWDQVFEAIDTL